MTTQTLNNLLQNLEIIKPLTVSYLQKYLKTFLAIIIPKKVICKKHQAPFDFFQNAFFGNENIIVWANRSGGKSFNLGLLSFLQSIFIEEMGIRILGGSLDQSNKVYEYIKQFFYKKEIYKNLLENFPTMRKTILKNKANIEILPASEKSVRGVHQPFLILDEADEIKEDLFFTALSIPQSAKNINAKIIISSTKHRQNGTMATILEKYKNDYKIYTYCIWEVMEKCYGECSGCVLIDDCQKEGFKKGLLCDGYYKYEDVVNKKKILSNSSWRVEWLCEDVNREGLVFANKFNIKNYIKETEYNPSFSVYVGIDPSKYVNPFAFLFCQKDENGNLFLFDELYLSGFLYENVYKYFKEKANKYPIKEVFIDPSEPNVSADFKKMGFNVNNKRFSEDNNGKYYSNSLIEKRLENNKIFISPNCKNFIREFNGYEFDKNNIPKKENDHLMNCLQFIVLNLQKKEKRILASLK